MQLTNINFNRIPIIRGIVKLMIKKDLFKAIDYLMKRPKTVVIILVLIALSPLFINLLTKS